MPRRNWLVATVALAPVALALGACSSGVEGSTDESADALALSSIVSYPHKDVCGAPGPNEAHCHAKVRTDASGNAVTNATPAGHGPTDLQSAYKVPAGGGAGLTVALVDAFDDPTAESDLAKYRSTFGLPACTTANGCFKKVNESGQESGYPTANTGWSQEISLDLDMVSAICPSCKILLVEANSQSLNDLGTGVNEAVSLGAAAISNSYGGSESSGESSVGSRFYSHAGVAITASSGDSGFGVEFPAASSSVIAVGGTSLTKSSSSRGWAEAAWSGGGSGCSADVTKPSWQTDTGCSRRTVVDVSAVADPNTGVSVFYNGQWLIFGGTSAASPIVAATLVATGRAGSGASFLYAHASDFNDVTTGSNGSCGGTYLCTAGAGYDGPTGLGTPIGSALASGASGSSSSSAVGASDAGAHDASSSSTSSVGTSSSSSSTRSSSSTSSSSTSSTTASSTSSVVTSSTTTSTSGSSTSNSSSTSTSSTSSSTSTSTSRSSTSSSSSSTGAGDAVSAAITIQSSWSGGYCANLTVSNAGPGTIGTWSVQIDLNQSVISNSWNATFSGSGATDTVTPLSWNATTAPGGSQTVGFCATTTGADWQPTVTSATGH